MSGRRPSPRVTWWTEPFWTGGADGELRIQRCDACGRWQHPPEIACAACGGEAVSYPATSGRGLVYTFTVLRHQYRPDVPVPYVVALVELPDAGGVRLTTAVVDCDPGAVAIGAAVEVGFDALGDGLWAPVFCLREDG